MWGVTSNRDAHYSPIDSDADLDPEGTEGESPSRRWKRTHRLLDAFRFEWRIGDRRLMLAGGLMVFVMMLAAAFGIARLLVKTTQDPPAPFQIEVPSLIVDRVNLDGTPLEDAPGGDIVAGSYLQSAHPELTMPSVVKGELRFAVRECNSTESMLQLGTTTRWIKYESHESNQATDVVSGDAISAVMPPTGPECDVRNPNMTAAVVSVPIPEEVLSNPGTWQYRGDIAVSKCLAIGPIPTTTTKSSDGSEMLTPSAVPWPVRAGVDPRSPWSNVECLRTGEELRTVGWFTEHFTVDKSHSDE